MRLMILGSANALTYRGRDNSSLLIAGKHLLLIDCAGSPWQKILQAGEDPLKLFGVFLTHGHADHVYGLPSLLHSLWLGGRKDPLPIWYPAEAEKVVRGLIELFGLDGKEGMFPLDWRPVAGGEGQELWREEGYELIAFSAVHSLPTIGLKVTEGEKFVVYSADTQYNQRLETLAAGTDLLVHECNSAEQPLGPHSTVPDVARLTRIAQPRRTLLIHLTEGEPYREIMDKLGVRFTLAEDGMVIDV